jgi:hypothetical protein
MEKDEGWKQTTTKPIKPTRNNCKKVWQKFYHVKFLLYIYRVIKRATIMKNETATILEAIKNAGEVSGKNSMGTSESYYNKYYMVKKCFTEDELATMSLSELNNILKLADFASDVEKEMLAGVWLDAQVAYQGDEYIKPSDPTFDEYYEETFNTK